MLEIMHSSVLRDIEAGVKGYFYDKKGQGSDISAGGHVGLHCRH